MAGHEALGRRHDRGAHAAQHLGDAGGRDVVALARARRALQPRHDGLAVLRVLELDADQRGRVVRRRRLGLVGLDVALLGEDAGHLALELRGGDLDDVVLGTDRVADPREVVGDRIGHRHGYQLDFVMPGMKPLCASSRRQMRHTPNLRYTARERPQRRQRVYSRVLYLDPRCWRTFWDVLATGLALLGAVGVHVRVALAAEGHAECLEQRVGLFVGLRRRGDGDVQAPHLVDGVVVDLGEDDLLAQTHRVGPASVERPRLEAAEVTRARERHGDQAVEELVGAIAAQRHADADRHALADLELGDGLAGAPDRRLLAGDRRELLLGGVEKLRILLGVTDAHVQGDLHELGRLHVARVSEALDQRGADLLEVPRLEACCLGCCGFHGPGALVELRPGPSGDAVAAATLADDPDARPLLGLGVDELDVGDVDGSLALDDAGLDLRGVGEGALMALDDVDALDADPLLLGVDLQDLAGLTAVLAADHDDFVIGTDLEAHAQSTSGASEM